VRIGGPAGSRTLPEDRNPLRLAQGQTGVTAGGTVTFTTYTCPVGRRARLTASVWGDVVVALAAGQTHFVAISETGQVTPNPQIAFEGGAPAGGYASVTVPDIIATAGDTVATSMTVAAGAGSVRAGGGVYGVEYDA
jgi:hypothetical protein